MGDFGVCLDEDCELSFNRAAIDELFRRIDVIEQIERSHADTTKHLVFLGHYAAFFQFRQFCARCEGQLQFVTQPTAALKRDSPEYLRTSRLNRTLDAGYKLQAWGVLPFPENSENAIIP